MATLVEELHTVVDRFAVDDRPDAARCYVDYWVGSGKIRSVDAPDLLSRWRVERGGNHLTTSDIFGRGQV